MSHWRVSTAMDRSARKLEGDDSETSNLLYALGHQLRRRILKVVAGEKEISPAEISKLLPHPLSDVSYHTRVLAECGAIELVRTGPVRGATQHFYRLSLETEWARLVLGLRP